MNLKEKMYSGHMIAGCMMRVVRNSLAATFARQAGLDFIMLDCEHGCYDYETLHDIFIALNLNGISGMVRVPELSKGHVSRVLDCGAAGVMIPMVNTVEEARLAVKYSKYKPIGGRGFIGATAFDEYSAGGKKVPQIMEEQNKRVITIAQVESAEAVENIDDIAAVEGVDVLQIGQADLSISLGVPGEFDSPIFHKAVRRVADSCKKHKKIFGMASVVPLFENYANEVGIIIQGTDVDFLVKGMKQLAELRDGYNKKPGRPSETK
ncbi:hpch/hpai aldolase [Synergistales bacterium]|nr:hpch/hpai aldolase [Synergistales bacterium]